MGGPKNLLFGHQLVLAAHVGTQDLGDQDGAVGLQVVLQEGNQHAGRRHAGVVQSVAQLHLAVLILVADAQATGLSIAQVGAGADLEIFLLPGRPSLDVAALDLQVGQVAGAALQLQTGMSRERNSSTL